MTEIETTQKKNEYQFPVNEYNEYAAPVNEYDKYGAPVNEQDEKQDPVYEYDEYVLTEEDIILKEFNTRYSKKGANVAIALVVAAFSTGTIIMSQKWVPYEPTTTTTTTTTTTITTTTTSTTTNTTTSTMTLPESDPDQVRYSLSKILCQQILEVKT